jgi:cytochrome c-type biogenesis protein
VTEFAAVFFAGLASAGSPCLLPLYPGFLAYLAASGDVRPGRLGGGLLGLLVLAGVLTTMVALGTAFVALTLPVGRVATGFRPVVDGVLVLLGLLLLVGRNPFQRLGSVGVAVRGGPFARAYLYGLVLGPLALPCAGPFFAALVAVATNVGDLALRLTTFVVFGLGFGLPLLALSLLTASRQRAVVRFVLERRRTVEVAAGVLLLVVGLADLVENWSAIRIALGV